MKDIIVAPNESSPAPLESQLKEAYLAGYEKRAGDKFDGISRGAANEFFTEWILTRRTEVSSCDFCDHKSCGYPNSDCRDSWKLESKVSPDLGKFHDLENDYRVTE